MSAIPSAEDIMGALNESGYLMEQEVASQLERLGFDVQTNRPFEDSDEGKSREMDVRALKRTAYNNERKIAAIVEIIAECKNSTNPFVFVGRKKTDFDNRDYPLEYAFPVDQYESYGPKNASGGIPVRHAPPFFHLGFNKIHYNVKSEEKAVQFCRIDRKGGGWHANHGGLFDGIFYPMAKAIVARKKELPKGKGADDWKFFWFLVPLVVVSGDLFYVDTMKDNPVPEARDFVTFRRQLLSKNLQGSFCLDFVRQDQLEAFVADCLGPLVDRATHLINNEPDLVLQRDIPWTG